MQRENDLTLKIQKAQTDSRYADELIASYLPFIKSETAKFTHQFSSEGDDELSIAMFAFYEAIISYNPSKGSFISLASVAIKNRLIDYYRKTSREINAISIDSFSEDDEKRPLSELLESKADDADLQVDRMVAKEEIEEFANQLSEYGLCLLDIADNCPKQERTLQACLKALDYARKNPSLLDKLTKTKKLPISSLSKGAQVERKTLQRHRKYLVGLLLAYTNGFEIIRGHLNLIKRKEVPAR